MTTSKYKHVEELERSDRLPNHNWIVVRIDGWHFHRFSDAHGFEKPNDIRALSLMNTCAVSMLEHFPDIVFAYGDSDEFSFIWTEKTNFHERRERILSLSVSFFTSVYVMKWREFFPTQYLLYPPAFDGRVVCYPRVKIIRDYLKWRQADCHINNQFNTCFWMLVKSGKTKRQAQKCLEGTQTSEKNELLFKDFGISYNSLSAIFRKGSCVFRDKVEHGERLDDDGNLIKSCDGVKVEHCDIIGEEFWKEHPHILVED